MRKVFFIIGFVLLSTALSGIEMLDDAIFNTSTESVQVILFYLGQNKGEEHSSILATLEPLPSVVSRLSNEHWDCIRRILNRFQSTKGDTYFINLALWYP